MAMRRPRQEGHGSMTILLAVSIGVIVGMTGGLWFNPNATPTIVQEVVHSLEHCPPVQAAQECAPCAACAACAVCPATPTCPDCPTCPPASTTPLVSSAVVATPQPTIDHGPVNQELKALLEKVAINNEVMIAVSNHALITPDGTYGILATFVQRVIKAGVKNFILVAMDDHTANAMKAINVPCWQTSPQELADKNQDNHGVSSQKFGIITEFLKLGYHVLLSDVDIVTLKNPFEHLYKDHDVEGLSDGFDERTAYGWNDGIDDATMGWSRYAQTMRVFAMNSGLFYIRANARTLLFMHMIQDRLRRRKDWDQSVYNEEMFFPSHNSHINPAVTVRVMDIHTFMNSKTLFKFTRKNAGKMSTLSPVMIHVNYHPDKWERMKAIIDYWDNGNKKALDAFPDGSCWNAPNC